MISTRDRPTRRSHETELHEIRVQGYLDDRWADGVEGLAFTHESDGTTTLTAPLADQAALHGLLNRVRDLNVPIISMRRVGPEEGWGTARRTETGTGSLRLCARLIGALFLAAFVLYGAGTGLVTSVAGASDVHSAVATHQTTLAVGACLMVLNSVAVVGLGVLFFPILDYYGRRTALAYLVARIVEGVFLALGVLGLLVFLAWSPQPAGAGEASVAAGALGSLALQWNAMAYQIAMVSLGLGSIFSCALLFRARLLPRWLPAWGVIGYAIFLAGAIAELIGLRVGVILAIPGGIFELALGIWLIVRGFQPSSSDTHDTRHLTSINRTGETGGTK